MSTKPTPTPSSLSRSLVGSGVWRTVVTGLWAGAVLAAGAGMLAAAGEARGYGAGVTLAQAPVQQRTAEAAEGTERERGDRERGRDQDGERSARGERPEGRGPGAQGGREQADRSERDRRRWRGRSMEGITPEQQQQLRRAMAEAWNDARVVAAREEIERSMEAYREALREAVLEAAPDLADVLPDDFDGRGWLGDQRGSVLGALRSVMSALPEEVQGQARRKHGELMRDEAVAAAGAALNEAYRNSSGPGDAEVARHEREFRRAYVAALAREVPEALEFLEEMRGSRPDEDGGPAGDDDERP